MQYTEDVDMAHGQPSFRAVFHMSHVIIVAIFKCAKLEGKLVKRHMHKLDFSKLLELLSLAHERISLEVFKLVLEFYIS